MEGSFFEEEHLFEGGCMKNIYQANFRKVFIVLEKMGVWNCNVLNKFEKYSKTFIR